MWEIIKTGTFYIISSPLFLIKNTYKYFHNRNEFNTAKKQALLSEAMTVKIEKLEATLKQARKEKHTIETI